MPNRLAEETSPYLLQHANNPVDWHPWGPEALEKAKSEDKPIFLSIGYSACHWCHVMEHESFESEEIASYLNEHFVSIKVDREERPDLDQIYMNAVQLLTGRGGWPMSVFLTPEQHPFFGGTYWPPTTRQGMPGFDHVLRAVTEAWQNRRQVAIEQSQQLSERIQQIGSGGGVQQISPGRVTVALRQMGESFDEKHGGFGHSPKFPQTMSIELVLQNYSVTRNEQTLRIVTTTLDKMAMGGIYDHLGGGFARYSVDERWLVPHFEKMLYDNALLIRNYVDGWRVTKNPFYAQIVRETCQYILRERIDSDGGFHSTEDADSEGVEGKFYVWTPQQIEEVLGDADVAKRFCQVYDITDRGNFEHANILNLKQPIPKFAEELGVPADELKSQMDECRAKLYQAREQRIRPGSDDKILTSWNGLMIEALADAGSALGEESFLQAAIRAADFLLEKMSTEDGRLLHTYRHGKVNHPGYLDDYTYLAAACLALYRSTFEEKWLDQSVRLMEMAIEHFYDQENSGFFYTADDHENLIARNKEFYDQSIPSGNGMAATVLAKLGHLLSRDDFIKLANETVAAAADILTRQPSAASQLLIAHDLLTSPTQQIVLASKTHDESLESAIQQLHSGYYPYAVVALSIEDRAPSEKLASLLQGKAADSGTMVYFCENFTCDAPQTAEEFFAN